MPQRLSVPKIKTRMQVLGLSSSRLAVKSQLSESTIDRILHGRANNYSDFTVQRLAAALECPVLELYDDQATTAALTAFTARAVEDVVVESVTAAVNVVVEDVAPNVTPQTVAETVPNIPVTVPSALDVSSYFEYIQKQHQQEMAAMTAAYEKHMADLRHGRTAWICVSIGSLVAALLVCCMCIIFA